jgi:hypothetical protein
MSLDSLLLNVTFCATVQSPYWFHKKASEERKILHINFKGHPFRLLHHCHNQDQSLTLFWKEFH